MKCFLLKILYVFFIIILSAFSGVSRGYFDFEEEKEYAVEKNNIMILFNGGIGFPNSKVLDAEHDSFIVSVAYSDGAVKSGQPSHMVYYYGGVLEYMISNHIGIQGGFCHRLIKQNLTVGGGIYEEYSWGGTYMEFNNPYLGLSLHAVRSDTLSWYLVGRGGVIMSGTIYPLIAAFDFLGVSSARCDLNGYSISGGTGLMYVYARHLVFGGAFMVNYYILESEKRIYTSDINIISYDIDIYAGVKF